MYACICVCMYEHVKYSDHKIFEMKLQDIAGHCGTLQDMAGHCRTIEKKKRTWQDIEK